MNQNRGASLVILAVQVRNKHLVFDMPFLAAQLLRQVELSLPVALLLPQFDLLVCIFKLFLLPLIELLLEVLFEVLMILLQCRPLLKRWRVHLIEALASVLVRDVLEDRRSEVGRVEDLVQETAGLIDRQNFLILVNDLWT